MTKRTLTDRVKYLTGEMDRLTNDLFAVERTDPLRYPENFEELTLGAALRGERLACSLRQLVYVGVKKAEYLEQAADAHGIEISHKEGPVTTIMLPQLLPHRKGGHSSEFLVDPIFFALSEYAMANRLPKLERAVVCFTHIYGPGAHVAVRDYDNIECKQLLDVVAMFTMEDDCGSNCDVFHTTLAGPASCTRVEIMPVDRFPAWLEAQMGQKAVSGLEAVSEAFDPTGCEPG